MRVSLLTPTVADLHISEGRAGQAISVSGPFALLTNLSASSLIGRLDRKVLLLSLTFLMIVSGTLNTNLRSRGRAIICARSRA